MFSLLAESSLLLPTKASTVAHDVDWLFNFVNWVTVLFTILIFVGTGWLAVRFRHKKGVNDIGRGPTHSNLLEIVWSVIPLIICLMIAVWGFKGYMSLAVMPPANDADTIEIQVTGFKWGWEFQYPNGYRTNTLHVPVNTKIRIVQTSMDVIHSLYLPQMRIKKDVVPGRYNKHWFEAIEVSPMGKDLSKKKDDGTFEELNWADPESFSLDAGILKEGTEAYKSHTDEQRAQMRERLSSGFDIYCTEYCGTGHSQMLSKVYVHPSLESYKAWLTAESDPFRGNPAAKDVGLKLIKSNGCFACHSVDGSSGTGPTWKDMWGHKVDLASGKNPEVDENYVRESILYPQKEIVKGFGGAMPSYLGKFSDRDLAAVYAYMKSISSNYKGSADEINGPVPEMNQDKNKTK